MPENEGQRGGTHEQHVKAGQQSHKNEPSSHQDANEASGEGRGWHGDSEEHAKVGKMGGEAVSKDREHMAEIGRKGGEAVSQDREHMAEIGREGGEARGGSSSHDAGSQGGSHEQHVKSGQQSHKNK